MFVPTITGFGAADVIDFYDPYATITGAQYAAGQLNLYAGATIVATLNLSGTYTNAFSVLPVNGGSTYQIDYLGGGTNTAPAGTTSADSYQWVGPVAGFWNAKANWDDVTAGKDPAAVAPGKNDLVTIGAAAGGAAQVIVGNGNAYSLTLDGETLLDGVFQRLRGRTVFGDIGVGLSLWRQLAQCRGQRDLQQLCRRDAQRRRFEADGDGDAQRRLWPASS